MTYSDDVKKQVSGSKGLLERASLYIPLYGGYSKRNTRRDVDREVRIGVVRVFKGVKQELEGIHRLVVETGDMTLARDVERIRTKTDVQSIKIEKAVNGYSGIWATIKKKDEELDMVIEWDVRLLEDGNELRLFTEKLRASLEDGSDVKKMVRDLENMIDNLLEEFNQRDMAIKGLIGDE